MYLCVLTLLGGIIFWNSNLQWVYHLTRDRLTVATYKHLSNDTTKGRQIVPTLVPIMPEAVLLNALSSTCTPSALPSFPSFPGSEGAATRYE